MTEVRGLPARRTILIAGPLLATILVLGGGGSPAPVSEAVVETAALLALLAAITLGFRPTALWRQDRLPALLIGAVLALPIVQMLPLPPGWWQALPGREVANAALVAVGEGRHWQPSTLVPDATLAGALALVPTAVLVLLVASLVERDRVRLLVLLTAIGLASALLGLIQFMRGADGGLSFYDEVHRGWAIGFFANRNAQVDLIAVSLAAGLLLYERNRARLTGTATLGLAVAALLMLTAGVATGSRMGMVSLAVPVALAVALAGRRTPGVAAVLAIGAAMLLTGGTALDRSTARIHDDGARAEIWGDSLLAARSVAPVGGGVGSFQPLYTAAERLDHVQPSFANRAHNDYLELAIEGGLPALALLALVLLLVGRRAAVGWGDIDPDRRLLARFAGLTTLILAVHSAVDYPLRTLTLLSVAGVALAGVASAPRPPHKPNGAEVLTNACA